MPLRWIMSLSLSVFAFSTCCLAQDWSLPAGTWRRDDGKFIMDFNVNGTFALRDPLSKDKAVGEWKRVGGNKFFVSVKNPYGDQNTSCLFKGDGGVFIIISECNYAGRWQMYLSD